MFCLFREDLVLAMRGGVGGTYCKDWVWSRADQPLLYLELHVWLWETGSRTVWILVQLQFAVRQDTRPRVLFLPPSPSRMQWECPPARDHCCHYFRIFCTTVCDTSHLGMIFPKHREDGHFVLRNLGFYKAVNSGKNKVFVFGQN